MRGIYGRGYASALEFGHSTLFNAESVREFQPRVCSETLGKRAASLCRNSEGVATSLVRRKHGYGDATPSELRPRKIDRHMPRVEATLGLELANAFSVKVLVKQCPNSRHRASARWRPRLCLGFSSDDRAGNNAIRTLISWALFVRTRLLCL